MLKIRIHIARPSIFPLLCLSVVLCASLRPLRLKNLSAGEAAPPPPLTVTADAPKPVPPKINDNELDRVVVAPAQKFPWTGKPLPPPAVKVKPPGNNAPGTPPAPGSDSPMDMSGDMIIKAFGPFIREEKKSTPALELPDKEVLTLTQNVEIEMLETKSVLRGEKIIIYKDMKTGETELVEAKGNVQLVSPERTGKGELMRFEMLKGPNGEVLKNQFTLIGDATSGKKATLWLRKDPADPTKIDVIEATRFVRDERLDTFKATGSPNAVITMADDTDPAADKKGAPPTGKPGITLGAPAPEKPAPKAAPKPAAGASGGMGSMSMSGGGKVNMRADAELFFDGPTGKLKLTRNVVFIKEGVNPGEGVKMCADDAIVTLDVPPPGQVVNPGSAFGGDMKTIECFGRVEIKSGISTILCDKMKLDQERNILYMEMNNPADAVLVFNSDQPLGGSIMIAPKTLKMNLDTRELEAGGPMKTKSFAGPPGSYRGNGPKPEDIKPLVDPKAKSSPFVDPKTAKPASGSVLGDVKK